MSLNKDCWMKVISFLLYEDYLTLISIRYFREMTLNREFQSKLVYEKFGIQPRLRISPTWKEVEEAINGNMLEYRYFCYKHNVNLDRFRSKN